VAGHRPVDQGEECFFNIQLRRPASMAMKSRAAYQGAAAGRVDLLEDGGFSQAGFASQYKSGPRRNPAQQAVESRLLCGRETDFSIHVVSPRFSLRRNSSPRRQPVEALRRDGIGRISASRKDITYFRQSITYLSDLDERVKRGKRALLRFIHLEQPIILSHFTDFPFRKRSPPFLRFMML